MLSGRSIPGQFLNYGASPTLKSRAANRAAGLNPLNNLRSWSLTVGRGLPTVENTWVLSELVELRDHITQEVLPPLVRYL
jgi:hypothetical protein